MPYNAALAIMGTIYTDQWSNFIMENEKNDI